jgi:Fungal specific transcription factor domain
LLDFTKPKKYTIEALVMYASSLRMYEAEDQLRLWLSLGVILRVALKMGLHRDPSNFSFISPFEAEMRRRIWSNIYVFDVLTSFAIGLPGMIRQIQSDVLAPRNLLDTDFGPESPELPPSRPSSELSPVSYNIAKAAIVKIFAKAADVSHSVEPPDYEEVRKLSAELDLVHDNIKPPLKFVPMQEWILDPPPVIFHREKLELIYQKSRCVLHRRSLLHPLGKAEQWSRMECVDAAMKILNHLEDIFVATQPAGQLSTMPFFFSARANDDFLLAAMILCLELTNSEKYPEQKALDEQTISDMHAALKKTYRIYRTPSEHYTPPEKAVKALELMMRKISSSKNVPFDGNFTETANGFGMPHVDHLASPDPAMLFDSFLDPDILSLEPYGGNFELGENLDWVSTNWGFPTAY